MSIVVQTQDGLEVAVDWTCPKCQHVQTDTVHPELGPYLSATCGACGEIFDDKDLSETDRTAWNEARDHAEGMSQ